MAPTTNRVFDLIEIIEIKIASRLPLTLIPLSVRFFG